MTSKANDDDQIGMRLDRGGELIDKLDEAIKNIPSSSINDLAHLRTLQGVASELIKALREHHSILVFLDSELNQLKRGV